MHEREWRLPARAGSVELGGVRAILIGDAAWRPSLVETGDWISGESGERLPGPDASPYARPEEDLPELWQQSWIWAWNPESKSVDRYAPGTLV